MAKRIIWSVKAKHERRSILEYWFIHNGNKNYSRKLSKQFRETVRYIAKYNYLGRATDEDNVRVTVCGNYLLFYELKPDVLEILSVWDGRQNPKKLRLK
ncbi:MAG: type II toxin-antitoxin system RelE/ParE family toxin [Bacteroidetes bacterium]|nr:type II toxin-antitoxin system RelE/ParE family toxin [Bacteroidota bacterium]